MFFNKLKEEMQNWVYVKLAKLEDKIMQRVANVIKAANQTPEELIKKYKHTQWRDVSQLVTAILEDRFNLTEAIPFATYRGNKTLYSINGYVGDTLSEAQKKIEKQEKIISIECNNVISKIKDILQNEKSTVKVVKAIKAVLKDV